MHHILTNDPTGILRMLPYDPEGGLTLEDWTPQGLHEVTLPPDAVMALLRAVPRELLEDALGLADDAPPPHWEAVPVMLCPAHTDCPRTCPGRRDALELREAFAGRPGLGTLPCPREG